eukprot:TRINITY_DN3468_c0_g1_i1.p1 TRINITY_DN3468_c0_g1~~TRINITY_DN3468_c0_g1_i1.p1  ORF type:complete len:453 (-),score=104.86 TRINITY_DN3468_c0_g1_i1:213-1571(-)
MGYLSDAESDADFECMIAKHREVDAIIEETHRQRSHAESDPVYHAALLEAARERARAKLGRRAAEQEEFRRREAEEHLAVLTSHREVAERKGMEEAFWNGVSDYHHQAAAAIEPPPRAAADLLHTIARTDGLHHAALAPHYSAAAAHEHAAHLDGYSAAAHEHAFSPAAPKSIRPAVLKALDATGLQSPSNIGSARGQAEVECLQRDMAAASIKLNAPPLETVIPSRFLPRAMPPPFGAAAPIAGASAAVQSFHLVRHGTAAKSAGESDVTGDTASPGGGRGTDGPWVHSAQRLPKHEREVHAMKAVTECIAVDLVLVAPLAKAVRTAIEGFGGRNVHIVAHPGLHHRFAQGVKPLRTDLPALFPEVDFSLLDPLTAHWETQAKGIGWLGLQESMEGFDGRVEALRDWLLNSPERSVAVVGPGEVLAKLAGVHLHHCQVATVPRSTLTENAR